MSNASGKFDYNGLDRILHEKARLGIMASLFTKPNGFTFNNLKELCNLTDGNLSRHIQILKEAELIEVIKGYEGNKPNTLCKLTAKGRKRFVQYLNELERVINDAVKAVDPVSKKINKSSEIDILLNH